jgi:hypothetical protein
MLTLQTPEWERQPGERAHSFQLFLHYLGNGGDVQGVARERKKKLSAVEKVAFRNRWADRARAYFDHVGQEAFKTFHRRYVQLVSTNFTQLEQQQHAVGKLMEHFASLVSDPEELKRLSLTDERITESTEQGQRVTYRKGLLSEVHRVAAAFERCHAIMNTIANYAKALQDAEREDAPAPDDSAWAEWEREAREAREAARRAYNMGADADADALDAADAQDNWGAGL